MAANVLSISLKFYSAFRAELRCSGAGAALGAKPCFGCSLRARCAQRRPGTHIDARCIIRLLRSVPQLLSHCVGFGMRVRGSHFFAEIGSTVFALSCCRIPAHIRTHPVTASGALVKMLLSFPNGRKQSFVVAFSANGPLNLISGVSRRTDPSSQKASCRAEKRARGTNYRSLEARHMPISTLVAAEPELESAVGR